MVNGRTLGVLAACLAFMLAAAAAGLVLFHTVQGPPGSTWSDYRATARGLAVGVSAAANIFVGHVEALRSFLVGIDLTAPATFANESMSGDNLTQELRDQGLGRRLKDYQREQVARAPAQ